MEKVLEYPLTPVFIFFSYADGTRCKTTKSKFFGTSLNDMEIVQGTLPVSRTILHDYLDITASVRTFVQYCETIRALSKVRSSSPGTLSKRLLLKILLLY